MHHDSSSRSARNPPDRPSLVAGRVPNTHLPKDRVRHHCLLLPRRGPPWRSPPALTSARVFPRKSARIVLLARTAHAICVKVIGGNTCYDIVVAIERRNEPHFLLLLLCIYPLVIGLERLVEQSSISARPIHQCFSNTKQTGQESSSKKTAVFQSRCHLGSDRCAEHCILKRQPLPIECGNPVGTELIARQWSAHPSVRVLLFATKWPLPR